MGFRYIIASFFTETITLNLSTSLRPIRIECRAFLINDGIPVPCCDNFNHKTFCQPETGVARVIVDIVDLTDPAASQICESGVDLNSSRPLALDCQPNGSRPYIPKYCSHVPINGVDEIDFPTSTKPNEVGGIQIWQTSSKDPKGNCL